MIRNSQSIKYCLIIKQFNKINIEQQVVIIAVNKSEIIGELKQDSGGDLQSDTLKYLLIKIHILSITVKLIIKNKYIQAKPTFLGNRTVN